MPAPSTTVVITGYNQAAYIAAAIDSVQRQSDPAFACVVVDDGSTDATHAHAVQQAASDPRVTVLTQVNRGPSAARNHGARHAAPTSRYLAFLDGDDLLSPQFIAELAAYLDAHPHVGLVTCSYITLDRTGRHGALGHRSRYVPGWFGFPRPLPRLSRPTPFVSFFCATGQGPFALLRRSVFEQTTGYDEGFWPHEDTDMFCQMALRAEVHHLERPLYWKREHVEGILQTSPADAQRKFRAFKPNAYAQFRAKWDALPARNPAEAAVLASARRHYRTRHRPLRDLKIALLSLPELFRRRDSRSLSWTRYLLTSALRGLLGATPTPAPAPSLPRPAP